MVISQLIKRRIVPDIIQLLPDNIANQIAAGEVIQRPASAVKELLENAVDAAATEIKLIVTDAGKNLIQVVDNGKGMSETDARMSFERHATSKISNIEDLFKIKTMGFRGEALASIAAVAQVELKTRKHEEELGTCLEIENSIVKSNIEAIFAEVEDKKRISSEQMSKFVSLSSQLPAESQDFPQNFAHSFKHVSDGNEDLAKENVEEEKAVEKKKADVKKADAEQEKEDKIEEFHRQKPLSKVLF